MSECELTNCVWGKRACQGAGSLPPGAPGVPGVPGVVPGWWVGCRCAVLVEVDPALVGYAVPLGEDDAPAAVLPPSPAIDEGVEVLAEDAPVVAA